MCKYTHIFLTKGCSLSKNKSKQKLYLQILFLVFLCNKHWGCVGTAFFFLVPCIIFVHAAHRKEMHTIYKLNILFISKAFKVQSCIHQLSWTVSSRLYYFMHHWKRGQMLFLYRNTILSFSLHQFQLTSCLSPISWGSYGIFFFLLQDYQCIFLLTAEDYALFLTSHTNENPPSFHCTL